ncbi:hypothetical protein BCS42_06980 [Crenothrix sp. D3]|nr:hypothetical protein BCS42_06980 [Crenothrix sp. D3]
MKKAFYLSLTALLLSGCTQTYVEQLAPQSHFDYPNSNVYPLGFVKGQASTTSFFTPSFKTSALEYEAVSNALAQKPGADMIVNSFRFTDVTQLLILPIYTVTYRVEGTAAKMTTGQQALH